MTAEEFVIWRLRHDVCSARFILIAATIEEQIAYWKWSGFDAWDAWQALGGEPATIVVSWDDVRRLCVDFYLKPGKTGYRTRQRWNGIPATRH